jgi:hypothetical protein
MRLRPVEEQASIQLFQDESQRRNQCEPTASTMHARGVKPASTSNFESNPIWRKSQWFLTFGLYAGYSDWREQADSTGTWLAAADCGA